MIKFLRSAFFGVACPMLAIWSAATCFGNAALAQEAPASSQGNGIEEIVVTAQRRSEREEDVPATVQAISQADLDKTGVVTFDNLDKIAPGVQMGRTGVFTQPSIRGISTLVLGPGQENNVATYIDGF